MLKQHGFDLIPNRTFRFSYCVKWYVLEIIRQFRI